MLNDYIRDLMNDMESEMFSDSNEDVEFSKYLKTVTPYNEEIQDKILKNEWDRISCRSCGREISVMDCSFIDGISPICKNGCK